MDGPTNGSYVSWRELNLALDPISTKLDDLAEKVDLVLNERIEHRTRHEGKTNRKATIRFWAMIIATLLSGLLVTVALSVVH